MIIRSLIAAALIVAGASAVAAAPATSVDLFCGIGGAAFCQAQTRLAARTGGAVHNHGDWPQVARRIARDRPASVRLLGQSQGCVAVLHIADFLMMRDIPVDTLICLDGASVMGRTFPVPRNVRHVVHWRQDSGLGGARLCKGKTEGAVCREVRGNTLIYEETLRPRSLLFGHYMVGLDPVVQRKAADLLTRAP